MGLVLCFGKLDTNTFLHSTSFFLFISWLCYWSHRLTVCFVFVWLCEHVCVCRCVCTYGCGCQRLVSATSFNLSSPYALTQGLSLVVNSLVWLGWLASMSPVWDYKHRPLFLPLTRVLESWTQVLRLNAGSIFLTELSSSHCTMALILLNNAYILLVWCSLLVILGFTKDLSVYSNPTEHIFDLSKSEYITQFCLCPLPFPCSGSHVLGFDCTLKHSQWWGVPLALALFSDLTTSPVDPFSLLVSQKMTGVIKLTASFLLYWELLWEVSNFC